MVYGQVAVMWRSYYSLVIASPLVRSDPRNANYTNSHPVVEAETEARHGGSARSEETIRQGMKLALRCSDLTLWSVFRPLRLVEPLPQESHHLWKLTKRG